jgi:hypothetical protein
MLFKDDRRILNLSLAWSERISQNVRCTRIARLDTSKSAACHLSKRSMTGSHNPSAAPHLYRARGFAGADCISSLAVKQDLWRLDSDCNARTANDDLQSAPRALALTCPRFRGINPRLSTVVTLQCMGTCRRRCAPEALGRPDAVAASAIAVLNRARP